jgi:16S rRNA (cytidine1402-2'-O)-methyltransferase
MEREESFIFYESPYRIGKAMADVASVDPERPVVLGRELTKMHEEILSGTAQEILDNLQNRDKILGEFAVCIYGKKQ